MSICEICKKDNGRRIKGYRAYEGKMVCTQCQREEDSRSFQRISNLILNKIS